ncbi:hypothetical protein [Streptococcus pneumoniae]|nr:hypothetical protein [Streptococcus pneumoniae]
MKRRKVVGEQMFWWIVLGIWRLGLIRLIVAIITAPDMDDYN